MLSLGGGAPDAYSLQVLRDGGGGGGGSTPGWATVGRVASNNNEALCSLAARQVRSYLLVLSLSSTYLLTYLLTHDLLPFHSFPSHTSLLLLVAWR